MSMDDEAWTNRISKIQDYMKEQKTMANEDEDVADSFDIIKMNIKRGSKRPHMRKKYWSSILLEGRNLDNWPIQKGKESSLPQNVQDSLKAIGSAVSEAYTAFWNDHQIIQQITVVSDRNKELGGRLIINLEKLNLSIKKLELDSKENNEYYSYSHKIGIAQLNTGELQNKIFGIECNFEELNGIDFKKGCYVGQENTARIKLKNKLSKKLLPIEVLDGDIKIDDQVSINKKDLGKILISDKYPFGLIKFKDENFDFNKKLDCGSASIKVLKPEWLK